MKKIIAFSRNIAAPEHPSYEWFCAMSKLCFFNRGRPLIFRFGNNDTETYNQKTPWFDDDNDIKLYWYDNEAAEHEDYIDYEYVCGDNSITFLFDDRSTRQFKTPDGNCIWTELGRQQKGTDGGIQRTGRVSGRLYRERRLRNHFEVYACSGSRIHGYLIYAEIKKEK